MSVWRAVAIAAGVALAGFGLVTWWALEGQEVVVLYTVGPDGSERATRVWIADEDGAAWIEAATGERPWYRELLATPRVGLERDGVRHVMIARPEPEPAGHARIRRLLRAKYGVADRWVGLLQDTSASIAVRLQPADAAPARAGGYQGAGAAGD